jgi:hypothetical protein
MNGTRNAPHSHYPTDVWSEADDLAARARDAEWEASDPNMRALAGLGVAVKAEGETFGNGWTAPR